MSNINKAQTALTRKRLSKLVRLDDGRILTIEDSLRDRLASGWTLQVDVVPDYEAREKAAEQIRRMDKSSDWVPANEHHPRRIQYEALRVTAESATRTIAYLQKPGTDDVRPLNVTEEAFVRSVLARS